MDKNRHLAQKKKNYYSIRFPLLPDPSLYEFYVYESSTEKWIRNFQTYRLALGTVKLKKNCSVFRENYRFFFISDRNPPKLFDNSCYKLS